MRVRYAGIRPTFAIALFCSLATVCETEAQECVTFQSVPQSASLTLTGPIRIASGSPGTFCALTKEQRYFLSVERQGYETRRLKFSLDGDDKIRLSGDRAGHLLRSLVLPGWGSVSAGHRGWGLWTFALNAWAGFEVGSAFLDYDDERDRFNQLEQQFQQASSQTAQEALAAQALTASREANSRRDEVIDRTIFAGYLYGSGIIETFLLTSAPKVVSIDGSTVTISTPPKSKGRAFARSFFFPGLGQKYIGKGFKGVLFQSAFLAGAAFSIEGRKKFRESTNAYLLALDALDGANTAAEVEAQRTIVQKRWDDRRDDEKLRNSFYIATGFVWLWNVVDALTSGPAPTGESRMDATASLRSDGAGAGLTFRF